ncbi:MAG: glycosyltransferase family 9 protein [Verrucomicrobiales bacterium]|nr:glycosyltransferase family 9 protein [Verrucomicrobiales bacterium]
MPARKLFLKTPQSPGDVVMLTAAVRSLHEAHPGKFHTNVASPCPALWENNPFITDFEESDPDVEVIDCHYPLIHQSNQRPHHFVEGYTAYLAEILNISIPPYAFKGDIHLSEDERNWIPQVTEITGKNIPYWIIVAGGKGDFTIKWWDHKRYQEVVDHFRNRIQFVQVGEAQHYHPLLSSVIDLRGKTDLRQLVRLVYHAQGVLCPVTSLMHLAAAVPTKPGTPLSRPCVVVAGGREPVNWEAYPSHRFLHTQGALSCCDNGGCWKARTLPLGDGDEKDLPENLCVDVTSKSLPRCMDMITSADVVRAIESYLEGGIFPTLTQAENEAANSVASHLRDEDRQFSSPEGPCSTTEADVPELVEVCGLRRSGLHSVSNWFLSHFEGPAFYVNDINHHESDEELNDSAYLPCLSSTEPNTPVADSLDSASIIMVGYEDARLISVKNWDLPSPLRSIASTRILILRDPFNLFASRLQAARQRSKNAFAKALVHQMKGTSMHFTQLWKRYAQEFLGMTSHLGENVIRVNYNRWTTDMEYRKGLSKQLNRPFCDNERDSVPRYGFGSSFDELSYQQRGSEMPVLNRWKDFKEDAEYRAFFDRETMELSDQIFGKVITDSFSRSLWSSSTDTPAVSNH